MNTFNYDFKQGEFVMQNGQPQVIDGINAIKLWIEKCIRTQLGRYYIYKDKDYGIDIDDLMVGKVYTSSFISAEIKREIERALLLNPEITRVSNFNASLKKDKLTVEFTVTTIYGEEDMSIDY